MAGRGLHAWCWNLTTEVTLLMPRATMAGLPCTSLLTTAEIRLSGSSWSSRLRLIRSVIKVLHHSSWPLSGRGQAVWKSSWTTMPTSTFRMVSCYDTLWSKAITRTAECSSREGPIQTWGAWKMDRHLYTCLLLEMMCFVHKCCIITEQTLTQGTMKDRPHWLFQ